ncbi:hypothetical protein HKK80_04775 [Halonotius sp. F2-221B]|uniref:DUF7576 family protein n=1 Tax=Halonotius sp. F2-221B TaxID=2731620 RepID=UPI00398AA6C4
MSDSTIAKENAPNCSVCGNRITQLPTHRVIATTGDDGTVAYKHFCSASCESSYHT